MKTFYTSEKLNLWDRMFNRYKMVPVNKGSEVWEEQMSIGGQRYGNIHKINRNFVEYHKIDRLTGGYEIIRKYLN